MNIKEFLRELKYSYHKNEIIYTQGSCFRLYSILKTMFPEAVPYYSILDGHWITGINGKYYDINGEINSEYIAQKGYEKEENTTVLASAYIPTYRRQTTSYNKYK